MVSQRCVGTGNNPLITMTTLVTEIQNDAQEHCLAYATVMTEFHFGFKDSLTVTAAKCLILNGTSENNRKFIHEEILKITDKQIKPH